MRHVRALPCVLVAMLSACAPRVQTQADAHAPSTGRVEPVPAGPVPGHSRGPDDPVAKLLETLADAERETAIARVTWDAAGEVVGVWLSTSTATNENVRLLARFPHLRAVRISCSREEITPDSLAALARIRDLQELTLRGVQTDGPVMQALGRLTTLRSLGFYESQVDAGTLVLLTPLQRLRALRICLARDFGDADVAAVLSFPRLEELDLQHTDASDESVPLIASLPNLKVLDVTATRITRAAVMQSGLPARGVVVKGANFRP